MGLWGARKRESLQKKEKVPLLVLETLAARARDGVTTLPGTRWGERFCYRMG